MAVLSVFGERLRAWRGRRGLSQLDLAIAAGTTPRYVSFIETGRSRPGRDVVLRLADALDLGLRDRNVLLAAAGHTHEYTELPFDDQAMSPVRRVVDHVLRNHDPFPAWCFGPGLRVLASNVAGERVFPGMSELSASQLVDAWCQRGPDMSAAEHRVAVNQVIHRIRREMLHHPHPDLAALLCQAEHHAGGLGTLPHVPDELVMCPTLVVGGHEVRVLATVLRFDKASDITMAELRVELMFPADEASEAVFRQLAGE